MKKLELFTKEDLYKRDHPNAKVPYSPTSRDMIDERLVADEIPNAVQATMRDLNVLLEGVTHQGVILRLLGAGVEPKEKFVNHALSVAPPRDLLKIDDYRSWKVITAERGEQRVSLFLDDKTLFQIFERNFAPIRRQMELIFPDEIKMSDDEFITRFRGGIPLTKIPGFSKEELWRPMEL